MDPKTVVRWLLGDPPPALTAEERADQYSHSYLLIRTCVGVIGILLPIAFIVGEMFFLEQGFRVRGSISAYYHSQLQDLFVAGLGVVGFVLATYRSDRRRTRDFWFSLVGGVAVLGVVFFPTWRSDVPAGAPLCGDPSFPRGCSAIEQWWGEATTARVHAACAIVFIASLALMSFLFARDELRRKSNRRMQRFHDVCGVLILLAGVWAIVGGAFHVVIGQFTALYTGEVLAIWAFGASWLFKGFHISQIQHALLGAGSRTEPPAGELEKV